MKNAAYGLIGLLAVVFVALKLLGKVAWSWWPVLSPIWITVGGIALISLTVYGIALMSERRIQW